MRRLSRAPLSLVGRGPGLFADRSQDGSRAGAGRGRAHSAPAVWRGPFTLSPDGQIRPLQSASSDVDVRQIAFGGASRIREWHYLVTPLPPPGRVTFELEWPSFGISEAHEFVSSDLIIEASRRSISTWPDNSGNEL